MNKSRDCIASIPWFLKLSISLSSRNSNMKLKAVRFVRAKRRILCAVAALLIAPSALQAVSVNLFSNFGPDPGYSLDSGYRLDSFVGGVLGARFTVDGLASLDYASVALFPSGPPDPQVEAYVYSDNHGLPSVLLTDLGSIAVDEYMAPGVDAVAKATTTAPSPGLVLQPGVNYWLVLQLTSPDSMSWALTSGDSSGYAFYDGAQWQFQAPDTTPGQENPATTPAFEIYGTAVPDSATFAEGAFLLVPVGLHAIWRRGARRARSLFRSLPGGRCLS